MVTKIDRCSRNTLEFLKLQDILFKNNITFVALDLPTSIDLATNKLIATTLSGIAEFENNRRKERQKQGIRTAQQEGKYTGRKSIINQSLIRKVKDLKENKKLSVSEISRVIGISRPTIYKVLKEELGYIYHVIKYHNLEKFFKEIIFKFKMQHLKLGYPFSYGDELTPEMARENRNKILTILLLIWALKVNQVQAAPLPGADGFTPTYICPKRQIYSREATALSTRLKENPNNENIPRENRARYDRRVGDGSILEDVQVRRKFKHATDFGILGNPNRQNYELFKDKLVEHMKDPSTRIKEGTYKKNIEVFHYFNEETGLNVMVRQNDNTFLSVWKLNDEQLKNVKDRGTL